MQRKFIAAALVFLAAGCAQAPEATLSDPVDLQGFEIIEWPRLKGYCTFYAADHSFDAGDETTWRFLFVKAFTPSRRDTWGVIGLNGNRKTLSEVSRDAFSRRYQLIDIPEIEVEVRTAVAGRLDGPGRHTGELRWAAPETSAPVPIIGNCER